MNTFFKNINLDIGNTEQVVNEYTLIIVKNVIFLLSITTQHQKYQPF